MSNRNALSPGTVLKQYRIEEVIGQGGFGITYLAFDTDLKRQVAVKECFPRDFVARDGTTVIPTSAQEKTDFGWALNRFVDEATTLARFRHPGIVQVLQILKDENNSAYMVLEFIKGRSFDAWLKELPSPPDEGALKAVIAPVFDALKAVHENGVVHRDIAPDNIYIRDTGQAVLLDFGAAKQSFAQHSRTMNLIVKDGYSAPEQYYQEGRQGPWTDIYAFAAVLYRAIAGQRPVDAMARLDAFNNGEPDPLKPLVELAPKGYSTAFLAAVEKALAPQARARPQSLQEWETGLFGAAGAAGQLARAMQEAAAETGQKTTPVKKSGKKPLVLAGSALAIAAGIVAFAVLGGLSDGAEDAWKLAEEADTSEAYTTFLRDHPASDRSDEARARLQRLNQPWSKAFGTPAPERAQAVAFSQNRIFVAGTAGRDGRPDGRGLVVALSYGGDVRWSAEIGTEGAQALNAITALPDGGVVVAGTTQAQPAAPLKSLVARLDRDGNVIWLREYGDAQGSAIRAIAVSDAGQLVAAGMSANGPNGNDDGWVLGISQDGEMMWQRFVGGPNNDAFRGMERQVDGTLVLAGERGGDFWLVKQSADGEVLLDRSPGGANADRFHDVAVNLNGETISAGQTESFGTNSIDGIIIRLTTDGKMPPKVVADERDDIFHSIAVTPSGNVLVAGYTSSRGSGQSDGWVRQYDAQLSRQLWERVVGGNGLDQINQVRILPDRSIIAVGSTDSYGAGSADFWIIHMTADGQYSETTGGNL